MPQNSDVDPAIIITAAAVPTFLAAVSVVARLVARFAIIKNAGRDEFAISLSIIFSLGMFVCIIFQVNNGLGRHISTLEPEQVELQLMGLWFARNTYATSIVFTKCAIILQYLRVFRTKGMRRACWAALGLVILYGAPGLLLGILTCIPVSGFWTGRGKCLDQTAGWTSNSALNIFTDIIILIIPMPALSSLRLQKRQKIGLMLVFGVGALVPIVSALRFHSLIVTSKSLDITHDNVEATIWSTIEVDIAIVCACLPTLKPILAKLFPRLLGSNQPEPAIPSRRIGDWPDDCELLSRSPPTFVANEMGPTSRTKLTASSGWVEDMETGCKERSVPSKDIFITTELTQDFEQREHDSASHKMKDNTVVTVLT